MHTAEVIVGLFVGIIIVIIYSYIGEIQDYLIDQAVDMIGKVSSRMVTDGVSDGKVTITAYVPPVFSFSIGV